MGRSLRQDETRGAANDASAVQGLASADMLLHLTYDAGNYGCIHQTRFGVARWSLPREPAPFAIDYRIPTKSTVHRTIREPRLAGQQRTKRYRLVKRKHLTAGRDEDSYQVRTVEKSEREDVLDRIMAIEAETYESVV